MITVLLIVEFLSGRKNNPIIFFKKILKKLLTNIPGHANIQFTRFRETERWTGSGLKGEIGGRTRWKPWLKSRKYPKRPGSCKGR